MQWLRFLVGHGGSSRRVMVFCQVVRIERFDKVGEIAPVSEPMLFVKAALKRLSRHAVIEHEPHTTTLNCFTFDFSDEGLADTSAASCASNDQVRNVRCESSKHREGYPVYDRKADD